MLTNYFTPKLKSKNHLRDLVQCLNCQEYGHTKTYCAHFPRCVRCAEHHPTPTCQNLRNLLAKCALCLGDHPVNYKRYYIHKDLKKLRHPHPRRNQSTAISHQITPTPEKILSTEPNPSSSWTRTYTNVTSNQEPPTTINNQINTSTILSNFTSDFQALITHFSPFLQQSLPNLQHRRTNNVPTT